MVNGNDILEHTEKCEYCCEIEERKDLSADEKAELQYECFINKEADKADKIYDELSEQMTLEQFGGE